jgi:hypothetical protein
MNPQEVATWPTETIVRKCWPIDAWRLAIICGQTKRQAAGRLVRSFAAGRIARLRRGIYAPRGLSERNPA